MEACLAHFTETIHNLAVAAAASADEDVSRLAEHEISTPIKEIAKDLDGKMQLLLEWTGSAEMVPVLKTLNCHIHDYERLTEALASMGRAEVGGKNPKEVLQALIASRHNARLFVTCHSAAHILHNKRKGEVEQLVAKAKKIQVVLPKQFLARLEALE